MTDSLSTGSTEDELAARIVELESRQAFQEDALSSLHDALVAQQQRIDQLEKMQTLIIERYRQSDPDIRLPSEEPPPPHY
ncbi:MAG: SlyX family protein [Pseudomonadota bacterium]